jgi:hypothetical protein
MGNQMSSTGKSRNKGGSARQPSLERFQVLNGFVDFGLAGLSRSEVACWLILFRDCKPNGLSSTSLSDLSRRGGMSRRQATRALRSLIGRGAVHVIRKGFVGKATVYSLYPPEVLGRMCPAMRPWLQAAAPAAEQVVVTDVSG